MSTIEGLKTTYQVTKYGKQGHLLAVFTVGKLKLSEKLLLAGPYERMALIAEGKESIEAYLASVGEEV